MTCRKQALFTIAWFRDKPNITRHGVAFGLSQSTAYQYLHEAVDVLADRAPDLHQALDKAAADGLPHLDLDGQDLRQRPMPREDREREGRNDRRLVLRKDRRFRRRDPDAVRTDG
ncbi:transposase family protein [Actinomadura sp. 7K507]|uniref:transposase family protein n=1 Tax=Actinomadura sp. 7K507 TaxID=2530365 RepID=UPI00104D1D85|nr:transposase family protein [Actinomadura sp. 7K507]TDC90219.1 transposase family protein [Actinomadura sp. 7K507]